MVSAKRRANPQSLTGCGDQAMVDGRGGVSSSDTFGAGNQFSAIVGMGTVKPELVRHRPSGLWDAEQVFDFCADEVEVPESGVRLPEDSRGVLNQVAKAGVCWSGDVWWLTHGFAEREFSMR